VRIELNPDWSEFLRLLLSHHVRFVLVGGHAVAGHGEPRLTEDLDVFVEVSAENASRIRAALLEFGLGDSTPSADALLERGRIWMIGRKPRRIDMLTEIDGVTFEECWNGRTEAEFEPASIPVIGLAELIKNKRASGRAKDLGDLERLEQRESGDRNLRRPKTRSKKSRE
jgi:hypothetical protein